MSYNPNQLIRLCHSSIRKNELYSKMIAHRDRQIESLQAENERLYSLLIDKSKDIKELKQKNMELGYKITQWEKQEKFVSLTA